MNLIFVFVLFIQSAIAHFNNINNNGVIEGTSCQLKSGENGTCIRLNMCSLVNDLLKKEHKIPETCGFMKSIPIVCCPKKQRKIERLSKKKCQYFELSKFGFIGNEDIKIEDIPKDFSRNPLIEVETETKTNILITTEKIIDNDAVIYYEDDDRFIFPSVSSNFGSNINSYSGYNNMKKIIDDKTNIVITTEKIIDNDAVIYENDDRLIFPSVSSNFGSNINIYSGYNNIKKNIGDKSNEDIPKDFSRFPLIEDKFESKANKFTTEKTDNDAVMYEDDVRLTFPLVSSRFGSNSNSFSGNNYKRSYEPNKKKSTDEFLFGKDYSQFSYSPTQKYEHDWFNTRYNFDELPKLDTSKKEIAALVLRETPNHILGGENTKPSEFPHMAALGYENKEEIIWLCGGSLITEEYVLTAAHCLIAKDYGTVKKIRLGEINKYPNQRSHAQVFDVEKVFRYPLYHTNSNYHDIALIKLNGTAIINKYVNTACLFTEEIIPPSLELVATGWGLTSLGGNTSDILQKVELTLFSEEYCSKAYPSGSKLKKGVLHKQQICAGGKENDKDTCQGDSGGPLQIKTSRSMNEDVYYIVGVTSFGKRCGSKNIPGIYSRVSYYIPWIENTIWPGNQ